MHYLTLSQYDSTEIVRQDFLHCTILAYKECNALCWQNAAELDVRHIRRHTKD